MLTGIQRLKLAIAMIAIVGGAVGMAVLALWPKHYVDPSPAPPIPAPTVQQAPLRVDM